jgi:signal transduction histidine kinase
VVWLDPVRSENKVPPPPISIESVSADDKFYAPISSLRFPAGTSSVQINYAAVSLSDPEAIRFRYKLQETDKDWHEVAAANPVSYRNLAPGSYHFSIAATDTNGVWSDKVGTAEFTILPAFYQTRWFLAFCILAAVGLLCLLYQLRLKQATQRVRASMEARLAERERIARDLHDTLLQSFHGVLLHFQAAYNLFSVRPDEAKQRYERAIDRADQALIEGRDAIKDMRTSSLANLDLAQSMTALMTDLNEESAMDSKDSVTFRVLLEGTPRNVRPIIRDEIYRIARESLRNAFHHAQARHIETEISYGELLLRLRFRDDGKGIDPYVLEHGGRAGHWGLPGIRERAKQAGAQLNVWSKLGAGTDVELKIPGSIAYSGIPARSGFRLFRKKAERNYDGRF